MSLLSHWTIKITNGAGLKTKTTVNNGCQSTSQIFTTSLRDCVHRHWRVTMNQYCKSSAGWGVATSVGMSGESLLSQDMISFPRLRSSLWSKLERLDVHSEGMRGRYWRRLLQPMSTICAWEKRSEEAQKHQAVDRVLASVKHQEVTFYCEATREWLH